MWFFCHTSCFQIHPFMASPDKHNLDQFWPSTSMFDQTLNSFNYCESILFRGAEISSFEDDGHICGYLTSWISLPTKWKKIQNYYLQFLTDAKQRPNTKQGQLRNYGLASDSAFCLTSRLKILIHGSRSVFSQPILIRRLLWHQTVN